MACGVARHFGDHHQNEIEEVLKRVKVTLLNKTRSLEKLKSQEDRWMYDLGSVLHLGVSTGRMRCWEITDRTLDMRSGVMCGTPLCGNFWRFFSFNWPEIMYIFHSSYA